MSWRFAVNAQDSVAQAFGWQFAGANSNGHRTYTWAAPDGTPHLVVGYGNHQGDPTQDANKLRRLMKSCQNGTCLHAPLPQDVQQTPEVGQPILRPGDQVSYGNGNWWVMDVDGGLAHIYDAAGQEDIVPEQELKVAHVPDWVFTSHVVKRSELQPIRPNMPAPWEMGNRIQPAEWAAFNDSPERDICPFCGGDMHDSNHSHDYCKVLHRRIAKDGLPKTQKCEYCKEPATKRLLWAEGMAYIPVCDEHEKKGRHRIEDTNHDEVVGVRPIEKEAGREWEELPRFQEHPDCPHCHRDALHFQYDEEGRPYVECAACEHQFMQDSGNGQLHDMTQGGGDWQAMPDDEPTGELWPDTFPSDWH